MVADTAPPCPHLLSTGICKTGAICTWNHALPHCDVCNLYFEGDFNYIQHTDTKRHRKLVKHPELRTVPTESSECAVCGKLVKEGEQARHERKSNRHAKALKQQEYDKARNSAEAPKFGVQILPHKVIDFGHVEFARLESDKSHRPFMVEISVGTQTDATLVDVQLVPANPPDKRRYFSVQSDVDEHVGKTILTNTSITFTVYFKPRLHMGEFDDALIATFLHPSGDTFTITRKIHAVVGVQADLDMLGPIRPYVPPKKVAIAAGNGSESLVIVAGTYNNRSTENDGTAPARLLTGPRDLTMQSLPWVARLPQFEVPAKIRKALLPDDVKGQIKVLGQKVLPPALSYITYREWWSTLLHVEVVQCELDIMRYNMESVTMTQEGEFYYLEVPGLAENRPSVLEGDTVKVQINGKEYKTTYEGVVWHLRESELGLCFNQSFRPKASATFDVQFTIPRIPTRRMLLALGKPLPSIQLLFPTLELAKESVGTLHNDLPESAQCGKFLNSSINGNREQAEAVRAIFAGSSGELPFIIFGPPGTGKTVTIIEACEQLLRNTEAKILLCAPSNSACDLLASRLISRGVATPRTLFRLNAASRQPETMPEALKPYTYDVEGAYTVPPVDDLRGFRVIVVTCISASILEGVGLPRGTFSHVFIDEAGQALEPEAFLPLSMATSETRVVLAGDPKQLGPIIHSPVASAFNYSVSLLERLMDSAVYASTSPFRGQIFVKLVDNYRSHPAILKYPNEHFYDGELVPCAHKFVTHSLIDWPEWPKSGFPVMFCAVRGRDQREDSSPSYFNTSELTVVKRYVKQLRQIPDLNDDDIGVISPYAAQVRKLRQVITSEDIMVGSTEQFQGQERSVIIISTVRSSRDQLRSDKRFSLGFLGSPKRFNVAVTRACAGLIVVGDPDILSLDPMWRNFLIYVHENGGFTGQDWEVPPLATIDEPEYDPATVPPEPVKEDRPDDNDVTVGAEGDDDNKENEDGGGEDTTKETKQDQQGECEQDWGAVELDDGGPDGLNDKAVKGHDDASVDDKLKTDDEDKVVALELGTALASTIDDDNERDGATVDDSTNDGPAGKVEHLDVPPVTQEGEGADKEDEPAFVYKSTRVDGSGLWWNDNSVVGASTTTQDTSDGWGLAMKAAAPPNRRSKKSSWHSRT